MVGVDWQPGSALLLDKLVAGNVDLISNGADQTSMAYSKSERQWGKPNLLFGSKVQHTHARGVAGAFLKIGRLTL